MGGDVCAHSPEWVAAKFSSYRAVSAHSCVAGLAARRMFFLSFLARVNLDCDFVLFLQYKCALALAHVGEASSCVAPALPALLLSSSPVPFLLSHFPSLLYLILRR